MKIIILHGDNSQESYDRLTKFIDTAKKRGWEITRLSAKDDNFTENLVTKSLFEKERLIIVSDIISITKRQFKWLNEHKDRFDETVVFYHPSTLSKTAIKKFPKKINVEEFKLPKLIWEFLDSFYPGNTKNSLLLLHRIVENDAIEFVFSLLGSQLRNLYWIKVDPKSLNLPSWRLGKLKRQASHFTEVQLKNIISEMSKADIKSKSSSDNLIDLVDFIIINNLE
jgi:DNA polymerase III delta subunit